MDGPAQRLVIVADDDAAIRLLCRVNLELEGYRVLEATGLEEISRIAGEEEEVALVLLDIHLGREDGIVRTTPSVAAGTSCTACGRIWRTGAGSASGSSSTKPSSSSTSPR